MNPPWRDCDEQYGIVVKIYEWIIIYLLSIRVVTRSLSSLFREEKALFLLKNLLKIWRTLC